METHISRRCVTRSCGPVLGKLTLGVIGRNKGLFRILVAVSIDGLISKLSLNTLEAFGSVWLGTLRLGEVLQALCLATHGALDLDLLLPSATVTVDGLGDLA